MAATAPRSTATLCPTCADHGTELPTSMSSQGRGTVSPAECIVASAAWACAAPLLRSSQRTDDPHAPSGPLADAASAVEVGYETTAYAPTRTPLVFAQPSCAARHGFTVLPAPWVSPNSTYGGRPAGSVPAETPEHCGHDTSYPWLPRGAGPNGAFGCEPPPSVRTTPITTPATTTTAAPATTRPRVLRSHRARRGSKAAAIPRPRRRGRPRGPVIVTP